MFVWSVLHNFSGAYCTLTKYILFVHIPLVLVVLQVHVLHVQTKIWWRYSEQLCGCYSSEELTVPCLGQLYVDDPPVLASRVALFVEVVWCPAIRKDTCTYNYHRFSVNNFASSIPALQHDCNWSPRCLTRLSNCFLICVWPTNIIKTDSHVVYIQFCTHFSITKHYINTKLCTVICLWSRWLIHHFMVDDYSNHHKLTNIYTFQSPLVVPFCPLGPWGPCNIIICGCLCFTYTDVLTGSPVIPGSPQGPSSPGIPCQKQMAMILTNSYMVCGLVM